jgi:hypothetical protein
MVSSHQRLGYLPRPDACIPCRRGRIYDMGVYIVHGPVFTHGGVQLAAILIAITLVPEYAGHIRRLCGAKILAVHLRASGGPARLNYEQFIST